MLGRVDASQPRSRGIAHKAKTHKRHRFQNLYRMIDAELLLYCWGDLNQDAASGVDKVSAAEYAENLHANVAALVEKLKKKRYRACPSGERAESLAARIFFDGHRPPWRERWTSGGLRGRRRGVPREEMDGLGG